MERSGVDEWRVAAGGEGKLSRTPGGYDWSKRCVLSPERSCVLRNANFVRPVAFHFLPKSHRAGPGWAASQTDVAGPRSKIKKRAGPMRTRAGPENFGPRRPLPEWASVNRTNMVHRTYTQRVISNTRSVIYSVHCFIKSCVRFFYYQMDAWSEKELELHQMHDRLLVFFKGLNGLLNKKMLVSSHFAE